MRPSCNVETRRGRLYGKVAKSQKKKSWKTKTRKIPISKNLHYKMEGEGESDVGLWGEFHNENAAEETLERSRIFSFDIFVFRSFATNSLIFFVLATTKFKYHCIFGYNSVNFY